MTQHSMSQRGRRRLALVGLVPVFAVALALVSSVGPTVPVGAQPTGVGGLELLDRTMLSTDEFVVKVRLPGLVSPEDVVTVAVHERVEDRSAFQAATTKATAGPTVFIRSDAAQDLDISLSGELEISLAIGAPGLELSDPGVYPVSIVVSASGGQPLAEMLTHLVIAPAAPTRSQVAVAVTVDVRPASDGIGDIDSGDPAARWIDGIVARPDLPVTIQVNGRLLDDSGSDPRIRALQERSAEGTTEFLSTPYVPINERSLVVEGLGTAVDQLIELGIESLAAFSTTSPVNTALITNSLPSGELAGLWRDRGVRDVIVIDDVYEIDAPVEVETATGPITLVVTPPRFVDAAPSEPVLAAHRTLAELAVIAMSADHPTATVLAFSTAQPADPLFISTLLDGLADSSPLLTSSTVSSAVTTQPLLDSAGRPEVRGLPTNVPIDRLEGDIAQYREAERVLAAYRSMIGDADARLLHDPQAEALLFSLGTGVSGADRETIAQRVIDRVSIEVQAIKPPPLSNVNLTSRSATYPFAFQNNANYAVRIEVKFITDKARFVDFSDGESMTLVLDANSVTATEVQVEALASGSFPLRIEMLSPDGGLSLGSVELTMRSTAPSGTGIVISIGAAAVLITWWSREFLRSRRRRQAESR